MVDSQTAPLDPRCRRLVAIGLTFGLSVCIAVVTLIPSNAAPEIPGGDKVHHVLAFMALTLPSAGFYTKALVRVVLAAALYAGLIEVIQPFVGRSGEIGDFLADLLGIPIGAIIGLSELLSVFCFIGEADFCSCCVASGIDFELPRATSRPQMICFTVETA